MNVGVEIIGIPINSFRCKLSIVHVWDYNPEADKSALHCDPGPTSPLVSAISLQLLAGPEARHQVTPGPGPGHAWGAGVRPSAQPHRGQGQCSSSLPALTSYSHLLTRHAAIVITSKITKLLQKISNLKWRLRKVFSHLSNIILLKYYLMEYRNYVFH